MARVVFVSELVLAGELGLVSPATLKETVRLLRRNPEAGKPLKRELAGCRSLRVEAINRLVYKLEGDLVTVISIDRRREGEAYNTAGLRLQP